MSVQYKFVLLGALMFALAIPMALKLVPPNPVYGIRTSKTLSSREIWYAANRSTGIDMVIAGIVIAVAALVVPRLMPGYSDGAGVLINAAIVIFTLVTIVARGLLQVRRL
jgi:uncharacterized membrane protein